ncbi:MAG: DUF5675 family protein [Candidatus Auribacterota bacterium]|nr:DUF5675 family protein [Candidatus Auribacterota bacterium]
MIPTFRIMRVRENRAGTWGVIEYKYQPFALTMELPWNDNKRSASCIEPGIYYASRQIYRSKYDSFVLKDVPGRDGIFLHTGNIDDHTKGCILVGEEFGILNNERAILASRRGFDEFMKLAGDAQTIKIEILRAIGSPH